MFYSSEENVDFLFIINPCEHIEDEHEMHSCNLVSSLVQYVTSILNNETDQSS